MAEGGFDPTDPTTDTTPLIPKPGDDDDDDDDATISWDNSDLSQIPVTEDPTHDTDSTQPFEPGTASTPSGGEQIPMATRTRLPQERGHLIAETSFGGEPTERMALEEIKKEFLMADESKFKARYKEAPRAGRGGGGAIIEVAMRGKNKWYPLYRKSSGDVDKSFNESLPKEIKAALGKSVTEELNETNAQLQELQNQEAAQQKAFQQAETRAAEAQRLHRNMDAIRARIADISAQKQRLEDTHGQLDKEAIQKLKDENRSLEAEHQEIRKQLDAAAKAVKQAQKLQQDINKTRLRKGETERRLGQLKAQKDAIQPTDKVKERIAELETKITEDNRVIVEETTPSSEREAAQARLAENEAERARLNEELEARERQKPLLERVKDIFKKYGWTLQAVALAVGVVLSALALAGLNGLKAGTKALGQGLKAVGQKLGSLLPGLIGSIVSFIFKAAGQVFSFLAEHAWLLILAVVAFFMERLLKKRRR